MTVLSMGLLLNDVIRIFLIVFVCVYLRLESFIRLNII